MKVTRCPISARLSDKVMKVTRYPISSRLSDKVMKVTRCPISSRVSDKVMKVTKCQISSRVYRLLDGDGCDGGIAGGVGGGGGGWHRSCLNPLAKSPPFKHGAANEPPHRNSEGHHQGHQHGQDAEQETVDGLVRQKTRERSVWDADRHLYHHHYYYHH